MDREADILKDRIEIAALHRSRKNAGERVRSEHNECQKCDTDPALHGKDIGAQCFRQIARKCSDQRTEKGENEHPQQH